ncbi:MAG TPA: enoyl-CoA hydratase/isomerase family protein [Deltaproteobacteria bacterium]|nr:enoyl-CoA hydratase/isomerase family protein [Deltaproteobacteria bacterium]HOI07510.1 enoyl-CoA hydratase/isomerase family protein [Deltaproteobacteria bacterium]
MAVVEWKKDGTVAIVTMNTPENRHNPDFASGIIKALEEAEADPEIKSVVLTSVDPKNWSLGIDLTWMTGCMASNDLDSIRKFMYVLNNMFKKILLCPMPIIAAINGHAFGDGTILACCCDFRFMRADRGFFCFPEVDINIPFLPGMLAIMKKALPYWKLEELVYSGKRAGAKELEECHAVVKASENAEACLKDAIEFARTFQKGRTIFWEHKRRLHKHIINIIDTEDNEFIEPLNLMVQ